MYNLFSPRWEGSIALILLVALASSAQAPAPGVVRPLSQVKFAPDEDVSCLRFELESGDLDRGPSTAIMKAAPNCVVPAHYHTTVEQLMIVQSEVATGMEGMSTVALVFRVKPTSWSRGSA